MAFARRIQNPEGLYFITFATVQWADVFTRSTYVDIVLESLRYCQKEKGLRIHAWCIMSNHVHLMISTARAAPKIWRTPIRYIERFQKVYIKTNYSSNRR